MDATSTESNGGDTATTSGSILVTVNAVADAPTLAVAAASGDEDTAIPLSISGGAHRHRRLRRACRSRFRRSRRGDLRRHQQWRRQLDADLGAARRADHHADRKRWNAEGDATSTESNGGDTATTSGSILVTVNAVADAPTLAVAAASGDEDTAIPLSISAALADTTALRACRSRFPAFPAGRRCPPAPTMATAAGR